MLTQGRGGWSVTQRPPTPCVVKVHIFLKIFSGKMGWHSAYASNEPTFCLYLNRQLLRLRRQRQQKPHHLNYFKIIYEFFGTESKFKSRKKVQKKKEKLVVVCLRPPKTQHKGISRRSRTERNVQKVCRIVLLLIPSAFQTSPSLTYDGICIGNSMICSVIWHKYHE